MGLLSTPTRSPRRLTAVSAPQARSVLFVSLVLGLMLFVWQLGTTGLVDETPPLFAASARAMADTGVDAMILEMEISSSELVELLTKDRRDFEI